MRGLDTEPLINREEKSGFSLGTKVAATVGLIVLLVVGVALYPRDVSSSAYTQVQEAVVCGANEGAAWCGITCSAIGVDPCAPATSTLCAATGTLPASTQVTGGGWAAVEFTVATTAGPVMNVAYAGAGTATFANGVIETVAVGTTLELQLVGPTPTKKFGVVTPGVKYFVFFTVTPTTNPPTQVLTVINVAESATNAQLAPWVDVNAASSNTLTVSGFSGAVDKVAFDTTGMKGQPGAFPPNTLFGACATTSTLPPPPPPSTTTKAPVTTTKKPVTTKKATPPPPPPATTKKATPKPPAPKPKPKPRPRRPRGSSSSS